MRNQAAVLYAPHDIRLEERPKPVPGPHEVLVEIKAVGVCGSDVHYYEHGRIGSFLVQKPLILGHESAGTIVEVGEGVDRARIGQRVAIEPGVPCRMCRECRHGRYNLCRNVQFFGTPPVDGAFTNYVTIPADFAYPLPDKISFEEGALMEPLSVGLWACRKARLQGGDRVLITGAGPIGLVSMKVALALGATDVIVTDVFPQRLEIARTLGATRTVNVAQETLTDAKLDADVLIECSGNRSALQNGIRSLRPAGRAVVVGMGPGEETSIPLAFIQNNEIELTGIFRYANTYRDAIALVASGHVDIKSIITSYYSLEQTEQALQAAKNDPANIKPIVVPERS
ncbi:L-iditol 2-dehydrogenase [Thermosporothrix hazakensis]|jgi:L-iditol 2-dehydrogenase|uniref:L-iditol 2-dehydrogenase n=1 Tax=Thermosporothrix hazakensis TaxID=644383 RepID=A0A326U232_THEHA|nr:NAD(P)-dependent alcohol dehydrogenase [Thermosporothrix hazakensis]PZW24033.1 L-iditol 2-dehydrogenase [Thermosporothrix hazakensis]GCE50249.1 sorbitol dehydrogenase [Thermosporothrix hazakensis]